MRFKRKNRLEIRCSDDFLTAIAIIQKEYPRKSVSDILHQAMGDSIRIRCDAEWHKDETLVKLRDRLTYDIDTDTPKKKK